MRYLFAIIALSAAAVWATSSDLSDGDKVASDHVVISSGPFKYAAKDHPEPDTDGKIVGTGDIGKSVYTSTGAYIAGTGNHPGSKRPYDIIRPPHATAQGLEAKADARTPTNNGDTLPAGHVSIGIPKRHETTVEEISDKMKALQSNAVRGKGEIRANQIIAKANAQPTRPLSEIKAEVDRESRPTPPANQPNKSTKSKDDKSGGGAVDSSTASGDGTTDCKRDGSFCTLGNRRKKTTASGKNAALTVTKKTAGTPKSRKAATDATTTASKKPITGSKTRLAGSKDKVITGSKKGMTSTPGKTSSTRKAGTTNASGKGANSTKATTTKKGKKGSTTKKPVAMAGTKSITWKKLVAKPAPGSSKKQTFTTLSTSKKFSSSVYAIQPNRRRQPLNPPRRGPIVVA